MFRAKRVLSSDISLGTVPVILRRCEDIVELVECVRLQRLADTAVRRPQRDSEEASLESMNVVCEVLLDILKYLHVLAEFHLLAFLRD